MLDRGDPPAVLHAEQSAGGAGRLECLVRRKPASPSLGRRALAHAGIPQRREVRSEAPVHHHTVVVRRVEERRTAAVAAEGELHIGLAEAVVLRTALAVDLLVVARRPAIDRVSWYSMDLNAITCMSCDERRRRRSSPVVHAAVEDTDYRIVEGLRHRLATGRDIRLVIGLAEAGVVENIAAVAGRIRQAQATDIQRWEAIVGTQAEEK
jgi:hypothetical protein